MGRLLCSALCVCAATLFVSGTAHAQAVELSGVWAPIFHEDLPERVAGPEVGDYLGLPLSDAGRMRARIEVEKLADQAIAAAMKA